MELGTESKWAFDESLHTGGGVASIVHALYAALGHSAMMAYLVIMAQRLHGALQPCHRPEGARGVPS